MPKLILLVGPPGSGKTTLAKQIIEEGGHKAIWINQDFQGRTRHNDLFVSCIAEGLNVVVDRMNFSKEQRNRYLIPAKTAGYETQIVVLHENFETCFERCLAREDHETIKTERDASKALNFFFTKYERVQDNEADEVLRLWPDGPKPKVCIFDIDGTMANIEHRLKHVRGDGKKNWKAFFSELANDSVNEWCKDLMQLYSRKYITVFCSGRPDDYRQATVEWLNNNDIYPYLYNHLFMRRRGDFRADDIIKEQILDFEILTRYEPYVIIDDRDRVVAMWRSRGYTVLQCADGEF